MNSIETLILSPAMTAFLSDVGAEARAQQRQQPGTRDALMTTAMTVDDLHAKLIAVDAGTINAAAVYAAAVELAARAAQLALGGSSEFAYAFDMTLHRAFVPTGARPVAETTP